MWYYLLQIISYYWTARIKYNRALISIAILFELISKSSNLILPFVFKHAIDCLANPDKLHSRNTVYLVLGYGLLWMLNPIAKTIQISCKNRVTEKAINLLIYDIFKHVIYLPQSFHLDKKTGGIMNNVNQIRLYFAIFWDGFMWLLVPLILEVSAAMFLVSYLYGPTYGTLLFTILATYSIINILSMRFTLQSQGDLQDKISKLSSYMTDTLLNFEAVKTFCNEEYELKKCSLLLEEQRKSAKKASLNMEILGLAQNIVIGFGLTFILYFAFTQIEGGKLVFSDFVLLNTYVLQFSLPMSYLAYAFRDSRQAYTVLKESLKIFDEKDSMVKLTGISDLLPSGNYTVQFENVGFSYQEYSEQSKYPKVIDNVSFKILAGKKLAIVGSTGSGKSTIAKLLLRFFDVSQGKILINDQDIRSISLTSLRQCIGIIPQDTILFNNSLYNNILYGNPEATIKEVLHAISAARLNNLVATLPEGYHSMVGERGVKLSGGERQRIAIARAILKKPKIFIFDEATSALDSKTEKEIQENLEQISRGVTTIIIAHRLSTIMNADQILVLDQGKIIELGSHQILLQKRGFYHHLWQAQQASSLQTIDA